MNTEWFITIKYLIASGQLMMINARTPMFLSMNINNETKNL